jgi:16S rRNA processing protein RimM
MSPQKELIAIGRVLKSVGVRGEVSIGSFTEDLQRFTKLETVYIGDSHQTRELKVEGVRLMDRGPVVKLRGSDTPEDASKFRGQYVFVEEQESVSPRDGSYFVHDIIGSSVRTVNGDEVGKVIDVLKLPAHDAWVIEQNGNEILLPATKQVVRQVDVGRKQIVIEMPKGLLDDED